MRLTNAQKDAILSLLKEKYEEKEAKDKETFAIKNKDKIEADTKHAQELKVVVESLAQQLFDINKSLEQLSIKVDPFRIDFVGQTIKGQYVYTKSIVYGGGITPKRQNPQLRMTDIERDLQLQSIGTEFDVEKFIKKYLE